MIWNYRVLAHKNDLSVYFEVHEVQYNNKNIPISYNENPARIGGENKEVIAWQLSKINECLSKPILWRDEKFPQEYIV